MIAATAISMLPWPEMMTTGTSGWSRSTCFRMSIPSIWLSFSQISRIISAGSAPPISAMHSLGVGGQPGGVALVLQDVRDQFADVAFVVDDQYIAHFPSLCPSSLVSSVLPGDDIIASLGCRPGHRAGSPIRISARAPRCAPGAKGSASVSTSVPPCSSMIFLTIGRPSPVPLLARRHVGFEQPRAVLGQADAVVGDGDQHLARRVPRMATRISGT